MCQSCGCSPCLTCGREIEEEVCAGCGKSSSQCDCLPMEDELSTDFMEEFMQDKD